VSHTLAEQTVESVQVEEVACMIAVVGDMIEGKKKTMTNFGTRPGQEQQQVMEPILRLACWMVAPNRISHLSCLYSHPVHHRPRFLGCKFRCRT